MSDLISPDSFKSESIVKDYINFPTTWNETSKSLNPGKGFATYHLKIFITAPQKLALEVPHFYSNYILWINKEIISQNGEVGTTKDSSKPQWLPKTVLLPVNNDTLDVVIQVSNFHHAKGGVRENIILGSPEHLIFKRKIAVNSNLILAGGLATIAITFLILHFFVKSNTASLYFAALSITWAIRTIFSNLYIFTAYFPELPWELCVKIEYITLYLTMIWSIYFLAHLFPEDVNNLFKYFFITCNVIFTLFTVFSEAALYTQFLPVFLSFCLATILYVIYMLIRAVIYEREGVWFIVSCIMLGITMFAYDLVAYQGMASFNVVITNGGYLAMFLLMSICLIYQFGFLKRNSRNSDMLTYEDLYGSNREQ
jgi:hypothetical protein